jgi:hypothetical protein
VHSPDSAAAFLACCPHLQPLNAHYAVSEQTLARAMSYTRAVQDSALGITTYPHILLELQNRLFTSAVIFGEKR